MQFELAETIKDVQPLSMEEQQRWVFHNSFLHNYSRVLLPPFISPLLSVQCVLGATSRQGHRIVPPSATKP